MRIDIEVDFTVEDADKDKEAIALEVIEEEGRKFVATVTDRLETQGLDVESFKFGDSEG